MGLLLKRVDKVVNWIVKENQFSLEELKYEKLVLRKKSRQKNTDMKWVKWIGIIIDERLTFKEH